MLSLLALVALPPRHHEPSTVVRSGGFEVFLAAPKGWTIETRPNRYDGLPAVLFRKGEAFLTAKNVMFVNLDRRRFPDLAAFVANRRADFLRGRSGAAVRSVGKLLGGDGSVALAFDFDDPKIPQYERRAYLTTADGLVTLILQCATSKARASYVPALNATVETFRDLHAPHPG